MNRKVYTKFKNFGARYQDKVVISLLKRLRQEKCHKFVSSLVEIIITTPARVV